MPPDPNRPGRFRFARPAGLDKFLQSIRRIGERSLVSRLLALLMLGAVAVYLIVNIGLWWTASNLIDDNLEKQAVRWLSELDELGTPLYASQGGRHVSNIDNRIKHFPEIAFIRYYDASGKRILGEYGDRRGVEIPPLKPDQLRELSGASGTERDYLVDRSILSGAYLRFISPVRVRYTFGRASWLQPGKRKAGEREGHWLHRSQHRFRLLQGTTGAQHRFWQPDHCRADGGRIVLREPYHP